MEDDVGVVSRLSWVNIIDVIPFFFSAGLTEHINTWRLLGDCLIAKSPKVEDKEAKANSSERNNWYTYMYV